MQHAGAHLKRDVHEQRSLVVRLGGLLPEKVEDADALRLGQAAVLDPLLHPQQLVAQRLLLHVGLVDDAHQLADDGREHETPEDHAHDGKGALRHALGGDVAVAHRGHGGEGPVRRRHVLLRDGGSHQRGVAPPGVKQPVLHELLLVVGEPFVVGEVVEHAPEDVPEVYHDSNEPQAGHEAQSAEHVVLVSVGDAPDAHQPQQLDQSHKAQHLDDFEVLPLTSDTISSRASVHVEGAHKGARLDAKRRVHGKN
mmetsp:Transcript_37697/g.72254  ORF Transcript_37697/g.72254 Transcript_37697/m.72254 type:complete len:253 (-) Transcript_37697:1803-2561(-)